MPLRAPQWFISHAKVLFAKVLFGYQQPRDSDIGPVTRTSSDSTLIREPRLVFHSKFFFPSTFFDLSRS
jgi:hypothetical protein